MGAIFFYIFIYFIGYYGSNILNMLTVSPFITNRYMAALLPVYGVAFTHAYVIVSSPPPQGTGVTIEYALLVFITLPVVVVTLGAAYFMWNSKDRENHPEGKSTNDDNDHRESTEEIAATETSEQKTEVHLHSHSHIINIATETNEQKANVQDEITASSHRQSITDISKGTENKDT